MIPLHKQLTINPCMTYEEAVCMDCPEVALHWAASKTLLHLPGFAAAYLPALEFIPRKTVDKEQTGLWKELQEEGKLWGKLEFLFPLPSIKYQIGICTFHLQTSRISDIDNNNFYWFNWIRYLIKYVGLTSHVLEMISSDSTELAVLWIPSGK